MGLYILGLGWLSLVKGKEDENLLPKINAHHPFPADRQPGRLLADMLIFLLATGSMLLKMIFMVLDQNVYNYSC